MSEPGDATCGSVNACASTFGDLAFAAHVAACPKASDLPGERRLVEMTEPSLAEDGGAAPVPR